MSLTSTQVGPYLGVSALSVALGVAQFASACCCESDPGGYVALSDVSTGSSSASPSLSQLPTGGGTVGPRQSSTTTLQLQVVPSSADDTAPAPYVPPPSNPVAANPGLYAGAVGLRGRLVCVW